ncbi:MAG: sialidase family protein [Kiritimatiellae bacterium]|nr:sialidase family protein [Kiritimatiellia bacterium]
MIETHVGIQGVCAWPNVTSFPDGTLIATIFNQPTHGGWEGDLDCWASTDQGQTWAFRGRPAPHEPATNRMNCAAGLARDGSLIVLASGWSKRNPPPFYSSPHEGQVLPPWVCRSGDEAKTWEHVEGAIQLPRGRSHTLIPFGTIVQNHDGTLGVSLYGWGDDPKQRESLFYISDDDGKTWTFKSAIAQGLNETTLLVLSNGRLLAAARTADDQHMEIYFSDDNGATWSSRGAVSLPRQIPGHMLCLADGRIVLCYGNRCANNFGIDARVSQDGGVTWGAPFRLANMPRSDGGYPASAQLADGRIVTVFYNAVSGKNHYEMSVTTWDVNEHDRIK